MLSRMAAIDLLPGMAVSATQALAQARATFSKFSRRATSQ